MGMDDAPAEQPPGTPAPQRCDEPEAKVRPALPDDATLRRTRHDPDPGRSERGLGRVELVRHGRHLRTLPPGVALAPGTGGRSPSALRPAGSPTPILRCGMLR
ncbi:hypothetical protein T261_2006 [Streptomyces lydicus]|nr:hypothetical protein T261_2006 [Streptomyces lydicus]